jgi:ferredoxin
MTRVICEPCIGVKSGECVDVCPVDCIHPKKDEPDYDQFDQLFINPAECIDCGACEAVCPTEAIFPDDSVPAPWQKFIQTNYGHYGQSAPSPAPPSAPAPPA